MRVVVMTVKRNPFLANSRVRPPNIVAVETPSGETPTSSEEREGWAAPVDRYEAKDIHFEAAPEIRNSRESDHRGRFERRSLLSIGQGSWSRRGGFLGRRVVRTVDNSPVWPGFRPTAIQYDLRDRAADPRTLEQSKPDVVIHLAARGRRIGAN